jgi:hypothetical protein
MFTVARQGNTNLALNVYYQIGGTASNGVDYAQIGNWVTIPAGAISNSVTITPINPDQTGVQTVVLQLAQPPTLNPVNFEIGVPSNATVYIEGEGVTNLPPLVNIIEPTDDETFAAPANIFIVAPAGDLDGYAKTVEFFAGTNSLGVFTNPPPPTPGSPVPLIVVIPQLSWTNVPVGKYVLTAVATDNDGASSTSAPVNVTVQPNLPPMVSIVQPQDGYTFYAPTNIPITSWIPESVFATNVEFFAGTNNLGKAISGASAIGFGTSYFLTWTNPPPGDYALTAEATGYHITSIISAPINITVLQGPPPNQPPTVSIIEPKDGDTFYTPTNVQIVAQADNPDGTVTNVEFFAGTNDLGQGNMVVLDPPGIGGVVGPVYLFNWDNVSPGNYPLTAVATDNGASITSAPVNITVQTGPAATNGYITAVLRSTCTDSPTPPPPVGGTRMGPDYVIMTVADADPMNWTNAQRLVTDAVFESLMPLYCALPKTNCVTDSVQWNIITYDTNGNPEISGCAASGCQSHSCDGFVSSPPVVRIISPADGTTFFAPINIPLYTYANDPGGSVASVEFFDGTNSLGFGQTVPVATPNYTVVGGPLPPVYPTNLFFLTWSNAPVGAYVLTVKATDDDGASSTSTAVKIAVLPSLPPPTNRSPIVSIVASDPVAIEGTNDWVWPGETNATPTWAAWPAAACRFFTNCGPKTATFTVRRFGDTNSDLTLPYDIGGTASNGVDYTALPGSVTIPAGERRALITIVPIDDDSSNIIKTVILALEPSTNTLPDYVLGFPRRAAAVIIDGDGPRPATALLPDKCFHFVTPGPDAAWFCIEYSTDMANWTPVCTNQVINGSIDFVDPDAAGNPSRFYRAVPLTNPPSN